MFQLKYINLFKTTYEIYYFRVLNNLKGIAGVMLLIAMWFVN
jgi:hypothetical protein